MKSPNRIAAHEPLPPVSSVGALQQRSWIPGQRVIPGVGELGLTVTS